MFCGLGQQTVPMTLLIKNLKNRLRKVQRGFRCDLLLICHLALLQELATLAVICKMLGCTEPYTIIGILHLLEKQLHLRLKKVQIKKKVNLAAYNYENITGEDSVLFYWPIKVAQSTTAALSEVVFFLYCKKHVCFMKYFFSFFFEYMYLSKVLYFLSKMFFFFLVIFLLLSFVQCYSYGIVIISVLVLFI